MGVTACVNTILMHLGRFLWIKRNVIEYNKHKIVKTYLANNPPFIYDEAFQIVERSLDLQEITEVETNRLRQYLWQLRTEINRYLGNHYAARSCKLLFALAKKYGINPLWITCDPGNIASRKTCEMAGGNLLEIVDLPEGSEQYQMGDRQRCRYKFDL